MEKSENKRVDVGIIRKISDTLSGIGNYASKKSERGLYKTMQKTECISLCEIMHDLYQKEPNVEKLIDRACKEAGFSKCERIYFGSSFCGQYFLNMSRKEINLLVEACKKQNIKLTMVLPIFTEKHLERAKDLRMRNRDKSLVETLFNICENYIKIKNMEKCEMTLEEINLVLDENITENVIEYNLLWYRVYTIKEMYKEAENILIDTFNLAKANGLSKKAAQVAIMIGKFYIDWKKDSEAAKYLDQGVNILKELGVLNG